MGKRSLKGIRYVGRCRTACVREREGVDVEVTISLTGSVSINDIYAGPERLTSYV